jgi:glycerol-3-phosphate dehydrogenase
VFGGKITTYRRLAEAALAKLQQWFPGMGRAWTSGVALPGGDFPWDGIERVRTDLSQRYPFLPDATLRRLISAYGTMTDDVLGDAREPAAMGRIFGADLSEREVDWLVRTEWATTAEDILWRRSKLGLHMSAAEVGELDNYLMRHPRPTLPRHAGEGVRSPYR